MPESREQMARDAEALKNDPDRYGSDAEEAVLDEQAAEREEGKVAPEQP